MRNELRGQEIAPSWCDCQKHMTWKVNIMLAEKQNVSYNQKSRHSVKGKTEPNDGKLIFRYFYLEFCNYMYRKNSMNIYNYIYI